MPQDGKPNDFCGVRTSPSKGRFRACRHARPGDHAQRIDDDPHPLATVWRARTDQLLPSAARRSTRAWPSRAGSSEVLRASPRPAPKGAPVGRQPNAPSSRTWRNRARANAVAAAEDHARGRNMMTPCRKARPSSRQRPRLLAGCSRRSTATVDQHGSQVRVTPKPPALADRARFAEESAGVVPVLFAERGDQNRPNSDSRLTIRIRIRLHCTNDSSMLRRRAAHQNGKGAVSGPQGIHL